ncbi:MAG: LytR C-terminal domain-containing protein [Gemmatimonadota bacterium]|nr:LytR C-terminal domain-containing protein [Gemmatimonadota bacterium]
MAARWFGRLRSLFGAVVLLGAGFLFGLFWMEWRGAPPSAEPALDPGALPLTDRIKVEVLNGAGEPGLAQTVADRLIARGFDVVAVDNAEHFDYATTHVLDRSGREGGAGLVAARLGTDSIVSAVDADLSLDATVIIGHDWSELAPPPR